MPRAQHIGIDVAQTCAQRAGCGWYSSALAEALITIAPDRQFSLYHNFGNSFNISTENGFMSHADNISAPLFGKSAEDSQSWWQEVETGRRSLPGMPQIVHSTSFHAPNIPGTKLIFTIYDVSFWAVPEYGTEINRIICQRETLAALDNASAFLFISESSYSEFEGMLPGWLDASQKPWRIIHPGLRLPSRSRLSSSVEKSTPWLFVGSVEPRKNLALLLDAYELYRRRSRTPRPMAMAGGSGWKNERIWTRIEQLIRDGYAVHYGYLPDDRLADLYATSFAFVFPSWYEGFGLPVLEAMGYGLPVLCSQSTSLPELAGEAALYFDPSSPDQLAELMLQLEENDKTYRELSNRALIRARRFGWATTARQTLDFYDTIVGS